MNRLATWLARQFSRTKIVVNGVPGESEVRVGWLAKLMAAAVIAGLGSGVNRLFYISAKIDVLEERTTEMKRVSEGNVAAIRSVADDLAKKYADAQGIHAEFLKKDDFYRYMEPEIGSPRRRKER